MAQDLGKNKCALDDTVRYFYWEDNPNYGIRQSGNAAGYKTKEELLEDNSFTIASASELGYPWRIMEMKASKEPTQHKSVLVSIPSHFFKWVDVAKEDLSKVVQLSLYSRSEYEREKEKGEQEGQTKVFEKNITGQYLDLVKATIILWHEESLDEDYLDIIVEGY